MSDGTNLKATFTLGEETVTRDVHWNSYELTENGIRAGYRFLISDEEIQMVQENASFTAELTFGPLIEQCWELKK